MSSSLKCFYVFFVLTFCPPSRLRNRNVADPPPPPFNNSKRFAIAQSPHPATSSRRHSKYTFLLEPERYRVGSYDMTTQRVPKTAHPPPPKMCISSRGEGFCGSRQKLNPKPDFVLFGRGNSNANHLGNKKFTDLVAENTPAYAKGSKIEKEVIVGQILDQLEENGGGFRRYDSQTGEYSPVSHETSRQKVMHAIQHLIRRAKKKKEKPKNKSIKSKRHPQPSAPKSKGQRVARCSPDGIIVGVEGTARSSQGTDAEDIAHQQVIKPHGESLEHVKLYSPGKVDDNAILYTYSGPVSSRMFNLLETHFPFAAKQIGESFLGASHQAEKRLVSDPSPLVAAPETNKAPLRDEIFPNDERPNMSVVSCSLGSASLSNSSHDERCESPLAFFPVDDENELSSVGGVFFPLDDDVSNVGDVFFPVDNNDDTEDVDMLSPPYPPIPNEVHDSTDIERVSPYRPNDVFPAPQSSSGPPLVVDPTVWQGAVSSWANTLPYSSLPCHSSSESFLVGEQHSFADPSLASRHDFLMTDPFPSRQGYMLFSSPHH